MNISALDTANIVIPIICIIAGYVVAQKMSQKLSVSDPSAKPNGWGYFYSSANLVGSVLYGVLFFSIAATSSSRIGNYVMPYAVFSVFMALAGFYALKRNKWGFLFITVFSINPIIWIANGIYLKNRWSEFSGFSFKKVKSNRKLKLFLISSGFWAFLVIAFVNTFEIYGSYMSDDEVWQVIKIILFPIASVTLGRFIYEKYFKREE